jgi:hypothetical protein
MNKSTRNLLVIFVILAAIVYLFFMRKEKISTQKIDEKLFVADSSKIDKIEIVKTGESITLEKINGQWMITKPVNYQADTNTVTPLLQSLFRFTIESITSENPEKFNNYLDSINHTLVTTYQGGKPLGTFELGKYALSYQNSYIKKPDENKILLAANLTSTNFTKSVKDFRYKLIFSLPSEGIIKMVFKSTDSSKVDFTCIKDSTGRWFIGNDSIPKNNMEGFLNLLKAFTTDDFKDTVITTFPTPTYTCTIFAPQETTINLYKENTTPVDYIVQVSNLKQLFKFSESYATNIMKKRKDFIPEPEKKK